MGRGKQSSKQWAATAESSCEDLGAGCEAVDPVEGLVRRRLRKLSIVFLTGLFAFGLMGFVLANESVLKLQEDPTHWIMPNQNYQGWNYSPLDRIDRHNVDRLQVEWTFQTGVLDSHEAQPLVVGDTMYILTPKPNTLIALDLRRLGYIEWMFEPNVDIVHARALACCGAQTRGFMYAEGNLYFNTLDGQLFAIDAEDGEVVWKRQVADLTLGETMTTSPLVVGDSVIVGNEGGERGVRGWVAAHDKDTGEPLWKYYSTGPNEEMGIGERFRPHYEVDRVDDVGTSSWYGDSWERGGGTVWGYWTYDPELDMIYYGTGNCAPWNPDYRRDPAAAPGFEEYGNKYCASTMARDAGTGELIWAYSNTPQDQWDFDEPGQNFVVDLEIDGELRQTLLKPARNGFFYVFDRATGELLVEPWKYTTVTWANGVDMETGIPDVNPSSLVRTDGTSYVCPAKSGNNWFNDAYSPSTGLVYFAAENDCTGFSGIEGEYTPGETYTLVNVDPQGAPEPIGDHDGELQARNPATGEKVWGLESFGEDNAMPLLATGGDVIFQGTDSGALRAVDARTGDHLWDFRTGSNFRSSPITYLGPDGRQYLAVIASQAPYDPDIDAETGADEAGRFRRAGSTLYVFGLPDR